MIWLLFGCVLFNDVEVSNCVSARQCQDAYGSTFTCNLDGSENYCEEIVLPPQCTATPSDLFSADLHEDGSNPYDKTYIIGQLFDSNKDAGKIEAADLAFDDILETQTNDKWLNDMRIARVSCDYTVNNTNDDANELVAELSTFLVDTVGVSVIVGPSTSSKTYRAFQTVNTDSPSTLFISPSATADILKTQDGTAHTQEDPGLFWRTTGPDAFQANILHWHISNNTEISDVAIIYEEGIYGEGLFAQLTDTFTASNITVHSRILTSTESVTQSINGVMGDASEIPALIFVASEPNSIVQAIQDIGQYPSTKIVLTDSAAKDEVLLGMASIVAGNTTLQERISAQVSGTKPAIPNSSLYNIFKNRLESADTNVFAAHTYDAMWLGALSIAWAHYQQAPFDLKELGRGIRNIADTNATSEIELKKENWALIRNQFEQGNAINLTGVSGNLDFNLETEELKTGIDIWTFSSDISAFNTTMTCYENDCEIDMGE